MDMMTIPATLAQTKIPHPDVIEAAYHITFWGWVVMVFSVTVMTVLAAGCIYKVIATPRSQGHIHSQADIEPPDARDG